MIADPWLHMPAYVSLLTVGGILLLAVAASLLFPTPTKNAS
jgi:hypothetical protein